MLLICVQVFIHSTLLFNNKALWVAECALSIWCVWVRAQKPVNVCVRLHIHPNLHTYSLHVWCECSGVVSVCVSFTLLCMTKYVSVVRYYFTLLVFVYLCIPYCHLWDDESFFNWIPCFCLIKWQRALSHPTCNINSILSLLISVRLHNYIMAQTSGTVWHFCSICYAAVSNKCQTSSKR